MMRIDLGNSVDLITKGTTPKSLGKEFAENGVKFLRAQNIMNGKVLINDKILFIDNYTHNSELKRSHIKKGDVLLTIAGTIGRTAIVEIDEELNCNQAVAIIRLGDSQINPKFLCYFFSSYNAQSQFTKGKVTATIPNLSLTQIKKLKIPIPPLEQQKKIASILDAADAYRQKTKALIEKYDELTQSLFLDMFGDPVTNHKGWDKVLFSEIATFHNGDRGKNYPSQSAFVEMGIPFINAGNLSNYAIDNQGLNFISNERFDLLSSGKIKREDILFCLRGSLGKFAVNRTHDIGAIASSLVLIRINNHVTLDYITGLLKTNYIASLIKKSDNGSSQPNLSAKSVKQFIVPLPSLELQNQFSERVQAIEEQKAQAEASLAQAEDLFNSLLQRAFKGELTS